MVPFVLSAAEIDAQLIAFGHTLKPTEAIKNYGTVLAQNIFDTLKASSPFRVGIYHVVGSYGKNTAIMDPDVDVAVEVFVDAQLRPPMRAVSKEFRRILAQPENMSRLGIESFYNYNPVGFRVTFYSGVNVDILPAPRMNRDQILKKIRECKNANEDWTQLRNGLLIDQTHFILSIIGKGNTTTAAFIRSCKQWFQSIHFQDGKFSGGKSMIELIAVAAIQQTDSPTSFTSMFLRVLNMMIGIDSIKLAFEKLPGNGRWRFVASQRLINKDPNLVPCVIAEHHIMDRPFFIIDPSNPFNDLLELKENQNKFKVIKRIARVTKLKISEIYAGRYLSKEGFINFFKLLKPHPYNIENLYPAGIPKLIRIRYFYEGYGSQYSSLRKPNAYGNIEQSYFVIALRQDITLLVRAVLARVESKRNCMQYMAHYAATVGVTSLLRKMIKERLSSAILCQGDSDHDHDNMDATLYVPYQIDGHAYAVRFSMSWN